MSSSDERWEAEQQQLLDARNHLASCQQWAQNALSMAENDGRGASGGSDFRAGGDSESHRSTCRRCLGDSWIDQSFATCPVRLIGAEVLLGKISVKVALAPREADAPSGAPLTVIFRERMPGVEDGPVSLRGRGHRGGVTA